VPYLNLVYIGIWVADRYLYFSAFCIMALTGAAAMELLRRSHAGLRKIVFVAAGLFALMNLVQKIAYQPAWRNGETFWQFHVALPEPAPGAYENLAAYYYAQAVANQGKPEMLLPLRKMSTVVDAGMKYLWPDRNQPPPSSVAHLLFLQAILLELAGKNEAAVESLVTSDRLRPKFDFTKLNLARLYRTLAKAAAEPVKKKEHALAAKERFAEYVALAFRGRPAPPAVQREQAEINAEFAAADSK
jgi:hypothetical protein